jgi:phosphoribosylformylglycinamidine synthase
MTKANIHITLKDGVLDPQGKAIQNALTNIGFQGIEGIKQGKFVEIIITETDKKLAHRAVESMCEKLLANTVIEDYHIEISE